MEKKLKLKTKFKEFKTCNFKQEKLSRNSATCYVVKFETEQEFVHIKLYKHSNYPIREAEVSFAWIKKSI